MVVGWAEQWRFFPQWLRINWERKYLSPLFIALSISRWQLQHVIHLARVLCAPNSCDFEKSGYQDSSVTSKALLCMYLGRIGQHFFMMHNTISSDITGIHSISPRHPSHRVAQVGGDKDPFKYWKAAVRSPGNRLSFKLNKFQPSPSKKMLFLP